MRLRTLALLVAATTVLHLFGFAIFLRGFFPRKVVLAGDGEFFGPPPAPPFSRMVFMVVDAMRADFVFLETLGMRFTQGLVAQGCALPFTAHLTPPTVTLPRLKGLTTGLAPSFLDAVLNIAEDDETLALGLADLWVRQLHRAGRRLELYGDDTWLRLFPRLFARTDGTNSLYVLDYTEVDLNVTRHLDRVLATDEWDTVVLHYLGLDHIGHQGGPHLPHMVPKQTEMDSVVERVYRYVEQHPDTLLVVAGDHGMNERGNHGGASAGETLAGLVLVSPRLQALLTPESRACPAAESELFSFFQRVQQIDLVPSLAALLGFPIPKNSLGVVIPALLPLVGSTAVRENMEQLRVLVEAKYGAMDQPQPPAELERLARLYGSSTYDFLYAAQETLALALVDYQYGDIAVGAVGMVLAAVVALGAFAAAFYRTPGDALGATALSVLVALSAIGSSLVEEEHQVWWWFTTIAAVYLVATSPTVSALLAAVLLCSLRVLRGYANSGQKHVGPALGEWFQSHPEALWPLVGAAHLLPALEMAVVALHGLPPLVRFLSPFLLAVSGVTFKVCQAAAAGDVLPPLVDRLAQVTVEFVGVETAADALVPLAQLLLQLGGAALVFLAVYPKMAPLAGLPVPDRWSGLRAPVVFVLMLQTPVRNVPLFLAFAALRWASSRVVGSRGVVMATVWGLCLQNTAFFCMGNTNLLATVDLSQAYNGTTGYNVVWVGVLTFVSNWSGPLYWLLALWEWTYGHARERTAVLAMHYAVVGAGLVLACIALRFHLFVWLVFSPKLLYFVAWSVLGNTLVDTLLGAVVAVT